MNETNAHTPRQPDRIISWKRIARYLHRSERTVRRWETNEDLPIHRLKHTGARSVYAYATELDDWLSRRSDHPDVLSSVRHNRTTLTISDLQDLSAGRDHAALCTSLSHAIAAGICNLPGRAIKVLQPALQGEKIHADYVISGSVRAFSGQLKVALGLTRTQDGSLMQALDLQPQTSNPFEIERLVTNAVLTDLIAPISPKPTD